MSFRCWSFVRSVSECILLQAFHSFWSCSCKSWTITARLFGDSGMQEVNICLKNCPVFEQIWKVNERSLLVNLAASCGFPQNSFWPKWLNQDFDQSRMLGLAVHQLDNSYWSVVDYNLWSVDGTCYVMRLICINRTFGDLLLCSWAYNQVRSDQGAL